MDKKIIGLIISAILLLSCAKNEETKNNVREFDFSSFSSIENLRSESLKSDKFLPFANDIRVIDSIICIHDYKSKDFLIHLFSKTGKHLLSVLPKGKGPKEALGAWQISANKNMGNLWVCDITKKSMFMLNVYKAIDSSSPIPNVELDFPKIIDPFQGVSVDDSVIYSTGISFKNKRVTVFNFNHDVELFGDYPEKSSKQISDDLYQQENESKIDVSRDGKNIVVASKFIDKVELFNSEGKQQFIIYGPVQCEPKVSYVSNRIIHEKETLVCYEVVRIVDEYIYALFNGSQKGSKTSCGSNTLLVFDLEGNPVKIFKLDQRIVSFDIDQKENVIYATKRLPESNFEYILKFNLPRR